MDASERADRWRSAYLGARAEVNNLRSRLADLGVDGVAEPTGIRAFIASKDNHIGFCNFCDRWTDHLGTAQHSVVVMSGAGLQARICRYCAEVLIPVLQQFVHGEPRGR